MPDARPTLTVATLNLRYGSADDGENAWPLRQPIVLRALASIGADLLGTQEGLPFQLEEIDAAFPAFGRFGLGRYHGVAVDRPHEAYSGEHCAVYYRRPRLELLETETKWLSATPDEPGTTGWGADLARVVTLGRLRDAATRAELLHLNTHFHWGREVTTNSVAALASLIGRADADTPVIVTGDFNLPPGSPEHRTLLGLELAGDRRLVDAYALSGDGDPDDGTSHSFRGVPERRIDWILVSSDVHVRSARIVRYEERGRYPSDHFPVVADLELPAR